MEQTAAAQQAAESTYGELQDVHRAVAEDLEAVVRDNQACAMLCAVCAVLWRHASKENAHSPQATRAP